MKFEKRESVQELIRKMKRLEEQGKQDEAAQLNREIMKRLRRCIKR